MKEKPYKFVVRLPTVMRERIAESAQMYRRSMNSEIVARLQASLSGISHSSSLQQHLGINPQLERVLRQHLDADEEALLQGYRRLSKEQRQALLKLLS